METAALSFERAWVLNAMWLLPLVVALFWWSERRRQTAIGRIVAPKLRALLAGNASPLRRWFRSSCVIAALGLLVFALAGPRLGYDTLEVPHRGRDVIIAVDVSRSMLATDIVPTRLDRAKLFAEDLIGELGGDRIGLVAFAGSAFLQAPLTLDHGAVLTALDELDTTVIPKGGTNLAEAIAAADDAFGKAEGFSRAVVIISDGEELSADGVAAAKKAAAQGVRIFTVGVGSPEGSEIPDGAGEFVRDPDTSKIVNSKLDEARMREIAEATGGFYTQLDNNASGLIAADGIGKMEEADITSNSSRRPIERYQWPLGAAIGLLILQGLVGERRRRRFAAAAIVAFAVFPSAAWAAPAGVEAYERGDYEKAREAFESRLRMEPEAPELQLNAGSAAYRLKDYAKASQYFSRATLSENPATRSAAEYNFANTLFRQGESQEDKEKKITDWKEAIVKYDAALKTRPDYTEAKENKERVEQLLKELEKEQKQDQKQQDQQQKNEQKKDQKEQQDQQQKQDQQKQDQQQKDQQQKDQQDQQQQGGGQQDEQQKEEQKDQNQSGSGSGSEQQKQDQQDQKQKDQQQKDQKPQEQEKKEGEQKEQQPGGQGQQQEEKKEGQGDKKKEEQQGGGQKDEEQKQEQQKKDQKKEEEKPGDKQGEEKKDEGPQGKEEQQPEPSQPGESRPQSGQSGDERGPVPQQPQEKKEGELRGGEQPKGGKQEDGPAQAAAAIEEEKEGKMNETQARALLRALQSEEGKVDLLERQIFQDVSKDW